MLVLILGVLLLTVIVPIIITCCLYRYLKRKYTCKLLRYAAFIPIFILAYFIWRGFYPDEDFYKEDYKEVTKLNFPEATAFLYKYASFPDQFGDYTSVFLIQTQPGAYNRLRSHLETKGFSRINEDSRYSPGTETALAQTTARISEAFGYEAEGGKSYYVALFNDHKTLLIRRVSW